MQRSSADQLGASDMLQRKQRVNHRAWLTHLMFWDVLLPLSVSTVPWLVHWWFQNAHAIEAIAVVMPIVAFLTRMNVGGRRITYNRCGAFLKCLQFVVFGVAALLLIGVEALLVLMLLIPMGAMQPTETDLIILSSIAVGYLLIMTFATFPGRTRVGALPLAERKRFTTGDVRSRLCPHAA